MNSVAEMSDARRELAARMLRGDGGVHAGATPHAAAITPRAHDVPVPMSAAQRPVWFHAAMAPDIPLYNESITIGLRGRFDRAAFEAAFAEILRRHESLRTSFAQGDGEPLQIVHRDIVLPLEMDDVGHRPAAGRDAAARAIATAQAIRPIDPCRPPLLRARIVRLDDDDHRLYLTLHHLLFDGLSIQHVVVPELAALYAALAENRPSPLPPAPLGYGDYAVWQKSRAADPSSRRQIDHWRSALADPPPPLQFASDTPAAATPDHRGSMEVFAIPAALVERIRRFAGACGVTPPTLLLAAFKAMLHRYTGAEDIIVGGVGDLRRTPELKRVVGYFLNPIALRTRPAGGSSFRAYLDQVRDAVLAALAAGEVPFEEVLQSLDIRRSPGAHPLFNVFFSMQSMAPRCRRGGA